MITPEQYYFPYLFNADAFNKALMPFSLSSYITYDEALQMPETLIITKNQSKKILLSIPFGASLMTEAGKLFYWQTDTNLVDIVQVSLDNLAEDPWLLQAKLDLSTFHLGKNEYKTYFDAECLLMFARKDSITYKQDVYEKFAVVLVKKDEVNILPFDWFNTINSEYDYVWPAMGKIDFATGTLYGKGMRMQDFCVGLNKGLL